MEARSKHDKHHIYLLTDSAISQSPLYHPFYDMRLSFIVCTLSARAILTAAARSGENEELWKVLSVVFGTHLQESLGHPETLELAVSPKSLSVTQSGYRVLCTNYTNGQLIGTQVSSCSLFGHSPCSQMILNTS